MSTNNILSPANGRPIIVPSQDIVLGLYYLSIERENEPGEGMVFADLAEIEHALSAGSITLHTRIKARFWTKDEKGKDVSKIYDTTPGRMMIADCLPREYGMDPKLANELMTKKAVGKLIDIVYRNCGQKATVIFCDRVMALGFREAAKAGISFGKDDMLVPKAKDKLVADTRKLVNEYEKQYADGLITRGEKFNKVVDAWSACTDKVADAMMDAAGTPTIDKETGRVGELNSVYMMAHSGARGSKNQMKQLAGMRGLMAKPSGEIIETPIVSNFKEGLTVLEYFNSTHGARKGLADTALKTANSGYLTRRLVDVAQDCIITEEDCGTDKGITLSAVMEGADVVVSLGDRILGRTTGEDVKHPLNGDIIAPANTYVDEDVAAQFEAAGVDRVLVRSVLTCETRNGCCSACYGRDLARGSRANVGEAVGVIAAQSIGEPGTQLTMRTFHIGGAAQVANDSSIDAAFDSEVRFENAAVVERDDGSLVVVGRSMEVRLFDAEGRLRQTFKPMYGARLRYRDGAKVKRGERVADWDPFATPIITDLAGTVKFEDLVEGLSTRDETDEATGIANKVIVDGRTSSRQAELKPAVVLLDKKGEIIKHATGAEARYFLPIDAILSVTEGDEVKPGDTLARVQTGGATTRDITGGLPRVAELFEARRPKDHAIIAEITGRVEFGRDYKNKRRVRLVPEEEGAEPMEYLVPKTKHLMVQEGDLLKKGEYLLEGNPAPQDILTILGVEALANYLVNEIQKVYRLQGVPIDDKHIEVIVRQMLQKVEITDSGSTTMLAGEHVDALDFEEANAIAIKAGREPAKGIRVLLGITKASLQTRSFFSAASFQETTRVLTEAAIQGKVDPLEGLKENVIVGRLIPAGTGGALRKYRKLAGDRDVRLKEQRKVNAPVPALPAPAAE
jgi:DNA-directed RNA polymerase subunit beta'